MVIEPLICFANELRVESPFVFSFLIPGNKQYRLTVVVKSECNTPGANRSFQAQLFHIAMA